MYLRRHDYNKPHRCPGWSGGGWRGTYDDIEPNDWDEDSLGPFKDHGSRRRHWWQAKDRCNSGHIWTRDLEDPWMALRFGRCTTCDVRTIPLITQWVDPTWLWFCFTRWCKYTWWDIRDHKRRWVDDQGPWWSLPDVIWRKFGWPAWRHWFWRRGLGIEMWVETYQTWVDPEARKRDRKEVMRHYRLL